MAQVLCSHVGTLLAGALQKLKGYTTEQQLQLFKLRQSFIFKLTAILHMRQQLERQLQAAAATHESAETDGPELLTAQPCRSDLKDQMQCSVNQEKVLVHKYMQEIVFKVRRHAYNSALESSSDGPADMRATHVAYRGTSHSVSDFEAYAADCCLP